MRIVLLTSSRADYGIYRPLLKRMKRDAFFELEIVAFGTHLSERYGRTIESILNDGFEVKHRLETLSGGDEPLDIAENVGLTTSLFAKLWNQLKGSTDLIVCLGDRYEMFAAVSASIPFRIPVAHLHGGETSFGAIDEIYRHCLSLMADIHFVATAESANRVAELRGKGGQIFNVGAMGLDNILEEELYSIEAFQEKFNVDLSVPSILVTFHPETMAYEENQEHIQQLIAALKQTSYQLVITMPNADTKNGIVRSALQQFALEKKRVYLFESMGTQGYLSAMKYCSFLMGNSSSGILEAASFGKFVINLGDRQKGRAAGPNVIHCPLLKEEIMSKIEIVEKLPFPGTSNIYGEGNTASKIIAILKKL
jgi:GDP/UDP-N,N'-diacetylbacillosamine 2-epimerase (hydrolysing)